MDLRKISKQVLFVFWQAVNPCSHFEEVMCVWTSASIKQQTLWGSGSMNQFPVDTMNLLYLCLVSTCPLVPCLKTHDIWVQAWFKNRIPWAKSPFLPGSIGIKNNTNDSWDGYAAHVSGIIRDSGTIQCTGLSSVCCRQGTEIVVERGAVTWGRSDVVRVQSEDSVIMRGFSNLQNLILKQSQTVKDNSNQTVQDFDASSSFV